MRNSVNTIVLNNEYILNKGRSLGKGATGQVFQGRSLKDGSNVAIKVIDTTTIDNQVTQYLLNMEKIAIVSVINPFVLRGIAVINQGKYCYLVSQLCEGGTLKNLIKSKGILSQQQSILYLSQILRGQCSLIGKGIIHRDLKPANILIHEGSVKIIDFGYCTIKNYPTPSLQYNVGSPSYMAPQAFIHNQYSQKSQIWAIGVTFYQCLNGKTFDDGRHMSQVFRQIKKNGLPYKVKVSQRCKKIINWCLDQDPRKRPTCLQLLNHLVQIKNNKISVSPKNTDRIIFNSIQNIESMGKIKTQKYKNQCLLQNLSKDDIVRNTFNKDQMNKSPIYKRQILSSYQARKNIKEKTSPTDRMIQIKKSGQKFRPTSGIPVQHQYKPIILKSKKVNLQVGSLLSDRKNVEKGFGFNPARFKIGPRYTEYRSPEYFGLISDR